MNGVGAFWMLEEEEVWRKFSCGGVSSWNGWVGDVMTRILRVVGSQAQKGDVIRGLAGSGRGT